MSVLRRAILALFLVLAAPSAAHAGVHVTSPSPDTLRVVDASDASNSVDLTRYGGDGLEIRDFPATEDSDICEQFDTTVVHCTVANVTRVEIFLGPGRDSLYGNAGFVRIEVHGEGGDDLLQDGLGDDLLDGGDGDDELYVAEGDDEVIGGDDFDFVSYRDYSEYVEAVLPDAGTSTGNGATGENDVFHADLEGLSGSWHVGSDITGNDRANILGGTHVHGRGGNDDISASGGVVRGGDGDDFIRADFDYEEEVLACGEGNDRLDADNDLDPAPTDCETIAPEFTAAPQLSSGGRVGDPAQLVMPPMTGTPPTSTKFEWLWTRSNIWRFVEGASGPEYTLRESDRSTWIFVRVTASNSAGGVERESTVIGPIGSARPAAPAPAPPSDAPRPPAEPPLILPPPVDELGGALSAGIASLARRWRGKDPRALARRRSIPHRLTFPGDGRILLTWTAAPPGPRSAASRPVVLARGAASGAKGSTRTIPVRPTKRGRALLRRARSLVVTLRARIAGDDGAAEATRSFRLRRR